MRTAISGCDKPLSNSILCEFDLGKRQSSRNLAFLSLFCCNRRSANERIVFEWRYDPASCARPPVATDHDIQVIVFCSEGYASSLAVIARQDPGLRRATDRMRRAYPA